jgi:hypothetical protein
VSDAPRHFPDISAQQEQWFKEIREEENRRGRPNGEWREKQEKAIEPFATIRASSFEGLPVPEVEFLDARKLLPLGHASLLTGATKVGKTYVALQAAVSCVTGTNWLNEPIKPGPVIFYSAEETIDVLHLRLDKICMAEQLHLHQLGDLHLIDLSKIVNAALITGDNRTESITETALYKALDVTMKLIRPVLLWVDNKGLAVTGSEISRSMAAAGARAFQVLAHRHHTAIGMLMHPSNAGEQNDTGASGSTANFAGYRSVIYMKKPKDGAAGVRTLENNLTNYSEGGTLVNLLWDFGRYLCTDKPSRAGDDIGKGDKAERVFMKLLRWHDANGLGDTLSPMSRTGSGYAPSVFAAHQDCEKVTPGQFKRAMQNLLDRKTIEIAERGPPSKRVKFIREVKYNL